MENMRIAHGRTIALTLMCATLAAAGTVTVHAVSASTGALEGLVHTLTTSRTAADTLPDAITQGMWRTVGLDARRSHNAGRFAGFDFYLAPAADGQLCLLAADRPEAGADTFGNCLSDAARQLKKTKYAYAGRGQKDGSLVLALLAVDGYKRLTVQGHVVSVRRNVGFVKIDGRDIVGYLSGPGVPRLRVKLPASPDAFVPNKRGG
jgi:hypothetical protein